jgi:hypothetical protein
MVRRKTIGSNPLDELLQPTEVNVPARKTVIEKHDDAVVNKSQQKQRITIQLTVDVIDRIKNAVYWTPGLTMAALTEKALLDAVAKLERENKQPFVHRTANLKAGRPIK